MSRLGHRAGPARESSMFCISYGTRTGPCGTSKGAVRHPYGHVRELIQPELTKIPHGRRIWPYGTSTGPLQSPHGLFTGCLGYQNPYGARKFIMHALKLYGPRTGRQNSYGAARGPYGPREWTYDFCSKQPGNSPYGARECDVTGALIMTGCRLRRQDTHNHRDGRQSDKSGVCILQKPLL